MIRLSFGVEQVANQGSTTRQNLQKFLTEKCYSKNNNTYQSSQILTKNAKLLYSIFL